MSARFPNIRGHGMRTRIQYFFYGTLLDPAVQEIVFGRRIPASQMTPAVAHGYARVYVREAWYPTLTPQPGGAVSGARVTGLTRDERARVDWFEDDDYVLTPIRIAIRNAGQGEALAYMPPADDGVSERSWTMDEWRRRYKRQFLMRSRRWMESNWDPGW